MMRLASSGGAVMAGNAGAWAVPAPNAAQAGSGRAPDRATVSAQPSARPVLIMAGGTGGHIFPGLAVAQCLRAEGVPVAWLGAREGMENELVPAHGLALHTVPVAGLRGKGWKRRLLAPVMVLRAVYLAVGVLRRVRPRSVLSMGGFAAGPGGIAAWLLRCPLLVHEQNRVPGVTNRWLAPLARKVLVGFADAFASSRAVEWVGNPVREEIASLPPPVQRLAARDGRMHLLVLGGSLGARALNLCVPEALAGIEAGARPLVRHQCGKRGWEEARAAYAQSGVDGQVMPFIEDMAEAYAWADLVVCRAGALTVAELCAVGVGALLVPFPHAVDDHQTRNAEAMAKAGAARVMPESELTPATLAAQLIEWGGERARLLEMAEAARTLARPDAARAIARYCVEVAA